MDKNKDWISVKDKMPNEGQLCIVYFPIGENRFNGNTVGPIAMAYYRENEGWIYADIPSPLKFEPYYWWPCPITRNRDALPYKG